MALGCQWLAGLAVELAVELAVALGTRSLVVGVDSDAIAKVGLNHFHCLILRQRLELTSLVLQLCQWLPITSLHWLDARLLKRYTTRTYTSSPPPHQDVLQLCQRLDAVWLDQLRGCLSWQQLRFVRVAERMCSWAVSEYCCQQLARSLRSPASSSRQRHEPFFWLDQSDPCFSCVSCVLCDPSSV